MYKYTLFLLFAVFLPGTGHCGEEADSLPPDTLIEAATPEVPEPAEDSAAAVERDTTAETPEEKAIEYKSANEEPIRYVPASTYRGDCYNADDISYLQRKLRGFHRMHKTGRTFLGIGIGGTSLGMAFLFDYLLADGYNSSGEQLSILGGYMAFFSVHAIPIGIILKSIANKRVRHYQNRINSAVECTRIQIGPRQLIISMDF
jgi:hypothetical protein